MHTRYAAGFTLISIMIVVAIIGILASIAYPSYIHQVRAARRTDARASLLQIATRQEQFYSEHNSYAALEALGYSTPLYSDSQWYQLTTARLDQRTSATASAGGSLPSLAEINAGDAAQGYVLIAAPRKDQVHDPCGGLTLDSLGRKNITDAETSEMAGADCW